MCICINSRVKHTAPRELLGIIISVLAKWLVNEDTAPADKYNATNCSLPIKWVNAELKEYTKYNVIVKYCGINNNTCWKSVKNVHVHSEMKCRMVWKGGQHHRPTNNSWKQSKLTANYLNFRVIFTIAYKKTDWRWSKSSSQGPAGVFSRPGRRASSGTISRQRLSVLRINRTTTGWALIAFLPVAVGFCSEGSQKHSSWNSWPCLSDFHTAVRQQWQCTNLKTEQSQTLLIKIGEKLIPTTGGGIPIQNLPRQ